ncbi:MAG TPA: SRPBCC family protein, partial [Rhodocyclaceae bacterium]
VQRVGVTSLAKAGSKAYENWHKAVLKYYNGQLPPHGAIWLTYYPNIMVEWYPHVLVVSTLIPQDVNKTLNVVEFYYPEDIALFEPEFVAAEQAAYMETAVEDDEIGERMDRGRHALWKQGRNEVGPYQSPMEDGMQHFHEFYRRIMGEALLER